MEPILNLKGVSKQFRSAPDLAIQLARLVGWGKPQPVLNAVYETHLSVTKNEMLGIVGESGCGKSTLGRIAVGLLEPNTGQRLYRGENIHALQGTRRARLQLKAQMIFQNPYAALNPRLRVQDLIGEAPLVHGLITKKDLGEYVVNALQSVGLDPSVAQRYPHQFSGGQRARIGIARALGVQPEFLVCDEAVAALDVSVQAQVLNLLQDLREKLNLSGIFISHNLAVIYHISDRVAVMYLGRIVELAPVQSLYHGALHPYTVALLGETAHPLRAKRRRYIPIKGELPSPYYPPSGCPFHPRCPQVIEPCRTITPTLQPMTAGHQVACHLHHTP